VPRELLRRTTAERERRGNPHSYEATCRGTGLAETTVRTPAQARADQPTTRGQPMNWDRVEGNWKQFKGKAKEQWGKLTDDKLDQIDGRREQLVGVLQKEYGMARDQAERDVDNWSNNLR
jgi:uncharacterized protein YjbJ (UPF0337 family)